jgi:transposase
MFTCTRGVTIRPKYACRTCTDGITQAPTPAWLIEGGLPTEGPPAFARFISSGSSIIHGYGHLFGLL